MTSKNLFWLRLIENGRRRLFIPILIMLSMFALYPLRIMAQISNKLELFHQIRGQEFVNSMTEELVRGALPNSTMLLVISIMAIVCGLQGYSYLFHRVKVDMYHSLPIKKSTRFWTIYLNGMLYFVIPYGITIVLSLLILSVQHLLTTTLVSIYLFGMLDHCILYFAVYNTAILAVMMTGKYLSFTLGVAALLGIEWGIRTLTYTLFSWFFNTFAKESRELILRPAVSVLTIFLQGIRELSYRTDALDPLAMQNQMGMYVLKVFWVGCFTAGIAYLCYQYRPEEAAGKSLAFRFTKAIIKMIAILFVSLTGGWMISSMAAKNIGLSLMVVIVCAICVHCVMEFIYEEHFKAILSHLWELAIGLLLSCFIFVSFQYDIFGYDTHVPTQNQMESAAVLFQPQYMDMLGYNSKNYFEEHMFLTDYRLLEELAAADYYHQTSRRNNLNPSGLTSQEDICYTQATVLYRLKNGQKKYRTYYIDLESRADLMQRIMSQEQYKQGIFGVYQDDFLTANGKLSFMLETRLDYNQDLLDIDEEKLIDALRKDLKGYDYNTAASVYQYGILHVSSSSNRYQEAYNIELDSYPIYASYENVLAYLQEAGYSEAFQNVEDHIAKVTIERYLNGDKAADVVNEGQLGSDFISVSYTDKEKIQQLLENCEDNSFGTWWRDVSDYENDITAYATLDNGNEIYYCVKKNHTLPEEILRDLQISK